MPDLLATLNRNPLTSRLVKVLGMPNPVALAREDGPYAGRPLAGFGLLCIDAPDGYAMAAMRAAAERAGAVSVSGEASIDVVLFDATGCRTAADTRLLCEAFHPIMRRLAVNGRVFLASADPDRAENPVAAAVARSVEGFMRALGKELGPRGIAVNLARVQPGAAERLGGPVRFFCGRRSTYVSGQVVCVTQDVPASADPASGPVLKGRIALVTGAARGIGQAIAERLAQEGAQVVALDVPSAEADLQALSARCSLTPLLLDIAAADASATLGAFLRESFGGVDIVVHNAGVTRDRTLANMQPHYWDMVVDINFAAVAAIDACLLDQRILRDQGRIVCLSSISGIAGNFGQTNYATSKAALIGYVRAQARVLAPRGICINAVAPGFIETAMTDAMPFLTRELGRRFNSLKQGGRPRDVAELVTFLATPGASGISGQTIRVCGQGLIGA